MIKVGIIGGSGYTAGELIRILMFHPNATLDFVYSTTNAGKPLSIAHHDLMGDIEMNFTDQVNPNVNVVFLCLGHGKSKAFLEQHQFSKDTKIIDLGNDFRLTKDAEFDGKQFVYGLPELNKAAIKSTLASIPENSNVVINASDTVYIAHDVLDLIKEFEKIRAKEENIKIKLVGFKKAYDLVNTGEEEKHVFVEHK